MTDPVTLAREVLETAHEDDTITVCTIPDNKAAALARTVIELTAERDAYREQVERVKAELEQCERDSNWNSPYAEGMHEVARRASAALNGETRG